ncbi:MAG: TonB-dependent receptor [Paludibacter sp.]|nr:TonB-dependent receptor [Paludibacter sp.]
MQKYILAFFLVCSQWLWGASRHTFSGSVTDATTGESLIGASILVKEMENTGVTTNSYGYFSLTVPDGKYTFIVSYLGYLPAEYTLNMNQSRKLNIKLQPQAQQLNDVEITAQAKNHNITSNEIGMEKMEVKEIAKIPVLFGEADIMKTLKLTPGIKSVGEGNGGMYVRGGSNSQNLILLDEATVFNADHLLGFFSTFNSDAIKDVQMYKGTAPAEYGGRISSVLDVKMNDGNNQDFHVGGGIGLISSRLNVEGPVVKDKSSFLVTARRTYADLFLKLSSDDLINNNQLYFYDINAKANYIINDKNRLYLSGYFGRDVFNFQERFGIDWGNKTGTFRWNHIWNEKLFSNTSVIYSDYNYKINIIFNKEFSLNSKINDWNLKHEFQYFANSKNKLTFGINAIYRNIVPGQLETTDTTITAVKLQQKHALENALYFSNEWKPFHNLNVSYGLRLTDYHLLGPGDFYTYENGELATTTSYGSDKIVQSYYSIEPRLNIAYILNDNNSFKTSYTRNTQNLHLISNATSSLPTDVWIVSDNNVKSEIGDQVSLGYFANFNKSIYQFSSEVYYRWMQNQIDLKNGANIYANEYLTGELLFGVGRAYGLELLLKKKHGKLTGWVGYTYSKTERKIDGINDGNWYPARQDITHDISIVAIYDLSKKWSFSASWVYNTGNAVTFPSGKYTINGDVEYYYTERNGYRMPDYHRLDLGATWTLKKTKRFESSLNFSIYNAYGHKNPYSIDFEQDENDSSKTNAVMTCLFTYVPSITYNFRF